MDPSRAKSKSPGIRKDINAIEEVIRSGLPIYFIDTSFGKEMNFDNEFSGKSRD